MGVEKIINYTVRDYKRNLWLITLFSVMFIASMLALFLAPTPTYVSLGGNFLRIGSIPELTATDISVIVGMYLLSLFIFADAITNINLIIKANRTLNKIPADIFKGIFKYALKIFFVYTMAMLLIFAVNIATFENPVHDIIYPLFSFLVFMGMFFVPPAVIIDEMDTFRAISASLKMVAHKWRLVLFWAICGLVAVSIIELISFAIFPQAIAKYLVIALNGLVVIPVLTIFQSQVYMEKYGLSP